MKSRRRIAFSKGQDPANGVANYSRDLGPAEWGFGLAVHSGNPRLAISDMGHKRTHALQQFCRYSITSSARASKDWGTDKPSAFAVFRLMASSYLFGASTGRSAGFSPRNMRST